MDPSFTRLIKLDILTALALEPKAIQAVLSELRTYISHEDKVFVCASIQAVGRIVEISRVVYGREGQRAANARKARNESNEIALNCLHGLITLSECSDNVVVVEECVKVMQLILSLIFSSSSAKSKSGVEKVDDCIEDPNNIQVMAVRKLVLLVIRCLTTVKENHEGESEQNEKYSKENIDFNALKDRTIILPSKAIAPAIWVISEWLAQSRPLTLSMASNNDQRIILLSEILRLLAVTFIDLDACVKVHAIHFVSKTLVQHRQLNSSDISILCEHILTLGRVDSNPDVRDRARHESNLLHMCLGLTLDADSSPLSEKDKMPLHVAEAMLLGTKSTPSWLPIDAQAEDLPHMFRFGTLSNMVSHNAGTTYMQLPPWSEMDSPSVLRDPSQQTKIHDSKVNQIIENRTISKAAAYSSSETDDSSEEESSSEGGSSSDENATESSYETSSDSDASTSSEDDDSHNGRVNTMSISYPNSSAGFASMGDGDILYKSDRILTEPSVNAYDITLRRSNPSSFDEHATANESNVLDKSTSKRETLIDEFDGLVMPPVILQSSVTDTNIALDTSAWTPLLRHEIAGGLSVMIRSVRGLNRDRALKLAFLNAENPAILCFDLKLENK
jgi:AP-3 complex subunit beta